MEKVYFRSLIEAIRIYGDDARWMIEKGLIIIGKPPLTKNQLVCVDNNGQYFVNDKPSAHPVSV